MARSHGTSMWCEVKPQKLASPDSDFPKIHSGLVTFREVTYQISWKTGQLLNRSHTQLSPHEAFLFAFIRKAWKGMIGLVMHIYHAAHFCSACWYNTLLPVVFLPGTSMVRSNCFCTDCEMTLLLLAQLVFAEKNSSKFNKINIVSIVFTVSP